MMRSWILFIMTVTLVNSLEYRPDTAKFHINVKEFSSRFIQHIEADMYRNHVYYHTPKHNKTKETHTMQDFEKGLHLSCWPELQKCFLNHVEFYPDAALLIESMARMWRKGKDSISSDNETTIIQRWIETGKEILDHTFLGQEMREFLYRFNFPLFWREKLPENAKIVSGEIPKSRLSKRRQCESTGAVINYRQCSNGKSAQTSYVYTDGACDHVNFCTDVRCGDHHIYGRHYFVALCCPDAVRITECFDCTPLQAVDDK